MKTIKKLDFWAGLLFLMKERGISDSANTALKYVNSDASFVSSKTCYWPITGGKRFHLLGKPKGSSGFRNTLRLGIF
jgi:hypothetical protein